MKAPPTCPGGELAGGSASVGMDDGAGTGSGREGGEGIVVGGPGDIAIDTGDPW